MQVIPLFQEIKALPIFNMANCIKLSKSIFAFAFFSLFFFKTLASQTVWPGDVNNNGLVSELDLLYLGIAFGETGPARASTDSSWTAQNIEGSWSGSFPNGINFAYADCNGDGKVDEADADIIEKNFLETHDDVPFIPDEVIQAEAGEDPSILFLSEDLIVPEGGSIDLDLALGSLDIPVDSILGLAFTIKVNPLLFQGNRTQFKFDENSWLNPDDELSISKNLKRNPKENGRFTVAFTRKDKMPVAGFGSLGTISFVLETDIINLLIAGEDSLKVSIDSVFMTDDGLEQLPVLGNSINLQLEELTDNVTSVEDQKEQKIKLYPNPVADWILIQSDQEPIIFIEFINVLGQTLLEQEGKAAQFQSLDLRRYPKGNYWLRIYTESGILQKHIQKL